ncbi:MAG: SH3 domain-containing protein [Candidatus Pseudobacter hemicellulosilyticus]|uniref:SH3 domain-containing protein n=1 Tax=Candidatus Pseudobacter hemicellulosilyticus TaxID=3121375 RepID=A0AAJ5WXE7_9BACT|nr:MAG: SH3 domain-containing protein [Pseudobacter sp.]
MNGYSKKYKGITVLLFSFFALGCIQSGNKEPVMEARAGKERLPDTSDTEVSSAKLIPGSYGEASVAIDENNLVTGFYGYYDAWDEKYQEFTKLCLFYFKGQFRNDSTIRILTAWPTTEQRLTGTLIIKENGINIVLNDIPYGYAAVDFTDKYGYSRALEDKRSWVEIRIVQSKKAPLFSAPDSTRQLNAYLIANDVVKVVARKDKWYEVEYAVPGSSNKPLIAWIPDSLLYDKDPEKW